MPYSTKFRPDELQAQAARAMLAALKDVAIRPGSTPQNQPLVWQAMLDAIAQAEAVGIKAEG